MNFIRNFFKYNLHLLLLAAFIMAGGSNLSAQKKKGLPDVHTSLYYSSRAEEFENSNSWEAAKREIDEGLKLYPDDPELLYLNGRYYYYAQRDLQKARYNLVKSLQQDDQQYGARRVLIDVEDDSKHYSSAVCYINELLEQQPYDRDLWRRKIALYNKMGNNIEANEALQRLSRIYPNDTVVKRELQEISRINWNKRMSSSSLTERVATLEGLINTEPDNLDYYMELSDVFIKLGYYDKALNIAKRGLVMFPGNDWLVKRVANLLSEQGLYSRALSFLNENHMGGDVFTSTMRDAANDARMRDAYEMNGRLYARTGDRDALTYLLNTSLTRGYYEDALEYLREAYRLQGRTTDLLLKEYALQKRMGNATQTQRLLRELFANNPDDGEIREEYISMQLALAAIDEEQQDWPEAYKRLSEAAAVMVKGSDQWVATMARRINLLGVMGKDEEARKLYGEASVDNPENRERFAAVYQDIVAKKIKQYIEEERYESALSLAQQLLGTIYNSEIALRTCINMSQTLKRNDLFFRYAQLGYEYFPEEPYFLIKQALALRMQDRYPESLALLMPQKEGMEYPSQQLINPYAGVTEDYASLLLKNKMPQLAIENIDRALVYDPDNRSLLYLKGLAYEQMKEYRLAYEYQSRNYNPSNAEQEEWTQHMRYLRYRSFKNRFDISYTSAFYDNRGEELASIAHMYSLASMSYTHLWKTTTLTIGANYKGTDGFEGFDTYEKGGTGLEGWIELSQELRHQWTMTLSGSYGTKFFNKYGANLSFIKSLAKGWSLGAKASYRLTPKVFLYDKDKGWEGGYEKRHLIMVGPRISKEWTRVGLHLNADFISIDLKNYYYNVGLKSKFFVNDDGVSAIGASVGFGSFPELTFFDQTTMNGITNMNAMVGVEGTILLTKNLFINLAGNWNTYYNPVFNNDGQPQDSYRNIYSVTASLHLAF